MYMDIETAKSLIQTLDNDYATMKKQKEDAHKALCDGVEKLAEVLLSNFFCDYEGMYVAREVSAKDTDAGLTVTIKDGDNWYNRSFYKVKKEHTFYICVSDGKETLTFACNMFNGKPSYGTHGYGTSKFMKNLIDKEGVILDLIHSCMEESTAGYIEWAKRRNNELNN